MSLGFPDDVQFRISDSTTFTSTRLPIPLRLDNHTLGAEPADTGTAVLDLPRVGTDDKSRLAIYGGQTANVPGDV